MLINGVEAWDGFLYNFEFTELTPVPGKKKDVYMTVVARPTFLGRLLFKTTIPMKFVGINGSKEKKEWFLFNGMRPCSYSLDKILNQVYWGGNYLQEANDAEMKLLTE